MTFVMDDEHLITAAAGTFFDAHHNFIHKVWGFVEDHIPQAVERLECSLNENTLTLAYPEINLVINLSSNSQIKTFSHFIENRSLSRAVVDDIRRKVREYDTEDSQIAANSSSQEPAVLSIGLRILRLAEQTTSHILSYRASLPRAKASRSFKTKFSGIDLTVSPETTLKILGKSPAEICESLLKDWNILHCENIVRSDLCRRFLSKKRELNERLQKIPLDRLRKYVPSHIARRKGGGEIKAEEIASYLVEPRLTFHGTETRNVASIVQCGFFKPGEINSLTGQSHQIRCGNTYGAGIYTSPNAAFSLSYSGYEAVPTPLSAIPGLKLIVCATIMGRAATMHREDNWREQTIAYPGADSHVANNQMEYVVFDTAQVLPCYVLHLDWRHRRDIGSFLQAKMQQTKPLHPKLKKEQEVLAPGDQQRLKAERMAQAKKFFAYGFGPLKGRDVIIEEIGETDDDEEDYGEYQKYRTDADSDGVKNVWEWDLEGATEFDEYGAARRAKSKKVKE